MGRADIAQLVVQPESAHSHTLIMLHGRGSHAERFAYDVSAPDKPGLLQARNSAGQTLQNVFPGLKIIFPTAPLRRCSARKRMKMNIWFDSASFEHPSLREELQLEGIRENARLIGDMLRSEAVDVGLDHIFLGGISEGCAMALYVLMGLDLDANSLAGFIGISGWLPFQVQIEELVSQQGNDKSQYDDFFDEQCGTPDGKSTRLSEKSIMDASRYIKQEILDGEFLIGNLKAIQKTPILLCHGEKDEVVEISVGQRLFDTLQSIGFTAERRSYSELGHWFDFPEGLDDMIVFLRSHM